MKKRLLSALLALALVFVLLPTTALAGETTYSDSEITISGKYWNFGNKGTSGEYAPVYFQSNGTAFQESKPTGSNYLEIKKTGEKEITITVYGTVNLTENESSTNSCISVNSNGVNERNLIITGAAKGSTLNLTCKNNSHPLYSYEGSITINGGVTVNATSQCSNNNNYVSVYGIQVYKGGHNLTISGANTKVNVANKTYDSTVKVDGNITVSDGAQLKAENKSGKVTGNTSKKAYAIECGGQFSISGENTKVTAKTSNGKQAISGTVSNGDKLTFKVPLAGSTLHQKPMDEALKYTHVVITQAPTDPYVFIAGKPAIMDQETPIPGGTGTYLYKKTTYDGSFLTLKGVDITGTKDGPARFIQFGKNGYYTIELKDENKISGFSSGIVAPNDRGVDDVTVVLSGSGSLDISAKQYAIDMQVGKLKFENTGKIMLTTGYTYPASTLNALHVAGNVTIDKTKYDIVGVKQNIEGTRENISDNPNLDTILKGTSTNTDLYFKTITITPAAAKPSTISYDGTTLKQGETIKDGKGGTATVDSKNNTITLNNFKGDYPLEFNAEFTPNSITLIGDSTLSAVETKYQSLTISGSGSLTVGSIKVHKEKSTSTTGNTIPNLTINGATVTVGNAEITDRAIDIDGDLTVTNGSLTATSTSTKPTVQVGGNASFTGSTVTITNNSTALHKDAADATKGDSVSSALYVKGNINITDNATVTAKVENGGGNAIGALGNITVKGSSNVTAVNKGQKFTTIIAKNVYVSGNSKITANNLNKNPHYNGWYLACPAIEGNIVNKNTDYSLKFEGEHSSSSEPKTTLAPGEQTTLFYYKVTITRGDAYTTPQVAANYTIAGQTMYVGKYYKTDANGNITDGTAQDYNIYCDSENDFTLNNATISSTGTDVAINTNIRYETNVQHHIKLIGTNRINNTFKHAISGGSRSSTIIIESARNASDASLTINGNFLPIYSDGKVIINAEVVIVNTTDDNSFKGLISTSDGKGVFDLGSGYKCYASTSTTGTPLEEFNSANYSTYKYLRVTTQTLETGGGSTHQHTSETGWETDGTNHWKTCSTCSQKYDEGACTISGYNNDNGASGYHKVLCSVGHVMKTELHDYEYKITQDGTMHYKECKICHYTTLPVSHNFGSSGTENCECGAIPSHTHNLSGQKGHDDTNHWDICSECSQHVNEALHTYGGWITDTPATDTTDGSKHRTCSVCQYQENATIPKTGTGEIVPPTPDNPGTIVIIRPAEEEKPAQQPNPSTGANDLVGLAVAAAVAAALGSAALLRKHD